MDTDTILSVVTSSETYDLTTLDRVKRELGITTDDDDLLIVDHIHESSAAFADACNRVFASEVVSETFYNQWRLYYGSRIRHEPLMLTRYPVTAIASVTEDGTTLASTSYEIDQNGGLLFRISDQDTNFRTSWCASKIVVVYTGGYTLLTTLPRKIEAAVITLVKNRWFSASRDPSVKAVDVYGVASQQYWVGSVPSGSSSLPVDVEEAVETYRDVRV